MSEVEVMDVDKNMEEANIIEDSKAEKETVELEEAENADVSSLETKIIRQIEYYFGDVNLPRDKFLLEHIKLDNGWIPLEVIIKFQRLASLSTDVEVIINSIKKSSSGLLEVSEDGKKIRRNPDKILPQGNEWKKEIQDRAVYCKGFPLDSTLDTLLDYFQQYGPIDSLIMRKIRAKGTADFMFRGSVFVVFPTTEKAEEFLKIEEVKFGETVLVRHWQADYWEIKKEERKKKGRKDDNNYKSEVQEQESKGFPKGTILGLKGELGKLRRKEIKSKVEEIGGIVAFVNCNSGDDGWVRLQKENSAKKVMEKLEDGKLKVKDVYLQLRAMEGEEEDTILKQAKADVMRHQHEGKRAKRGFHSNRKQK